MVKMKSGKKTINKMNLSLVHLFYLMIYALILCIIISCNNVSTSSITISNNSNKLVIRDKDDIANSFIGNIEYFRTDSSKWDPANLYDPYSIRYSLKEDKYVQSPLPTNEQVIIKVDSIFYSKDSLFCFALVIVESKYSSIPGLEDYDSDGRYDACAVIGYRITTLQSFKIYPEIKYKVIGFNSMKKASSAILHLYSHLKGLGPSGSVYRKMKFRHSLGSPLFFEKSPFFQRYNDSLYNFQIYRHLGKDHIYDYPF